MIQTGNLPAQIARHAALRPQHPALVQDSTVLSYGALDQLMNRVAAALQRDGVRPGQAIALIGHSTPLLAAVFLGALRAGVVAAPLAASSSAETLALMLGDAQARRIFVDSSAAHRLPADALARCVTLDSDAPGTPDTTGMRGMALENWLAPVGAQPTAVSLAPAHPFNIIYSSGTTGTPKGIVQSHGMRWNHVQRAAPYGYGTHGVTLLATPLYSNTTLVVFFPTLAFGGTVVLMQKFHAADYLQLAQQHGATHTMLVPVQYQRIMALAEFDRYDLSSFDTKFCTSAPFPAALKADVLARWPGRLVEFYGMTEGGGTCILQAHAHPHKLHTVGQPADGHDLRLIDEAGVEVAAGQMGEVVGHSPAMMNGYHGRPEQTRQAEWFSPAGKRYIRTGDIGRFDEDGFLTLMDRKKDVVISGGFNIYPSDLEAVLMAHPAVAECAVFGVASDTWGETPVACVVLKPQQYGGPGVSAEELRAWANTRVGKTQRLADVRCVAELPRSAIGKVLKRELRQEWQT